MYTDFQELSPGRQRSRRIHQLPYRYLGSHALICPWRVGIEEVLYTSRLEGRPGGIYSSFCSCSILIATIWIEQSHQSFVSLFLSLDFLPLSLSVSLPLVALEEARLVLCQTVRRIVHLVLYSSSLSPPNRPTRRVHRCTPLTFPHIHTRQVSPSHLPQAIGIPRSSPLPPEV